MSCSGGSWTPDRSRTKGGEGGILEAFGITSTRPHSGCKVQEVCKLTGDMEGYDSDAKSPLAGMPIRTALWVSWDNEIRGAD